MTKILLALLVPLFFLTILGILYLVYNIIKKLTLKYRHDTKINKRIIRLVVFCVTSFIILFICKDLRVSSKDRMEEISDIRLPSEFKVLKDEYQDMLQDYCILYDIQFDHNATIEVIKGIKAAKFYNSNVNPNTMLNDSLFIKVDNEKAIWCKSEKGYSFSRQDGYSTYSIELDTSTNILNYNECAD